MVKEIDTINNTNRTRYDFSKLKELLDSQDKVTKTKFAEDYCGICDDTLNRIFGGHDATLSTIDCLVKGLDKLDKSKKHTPEDLYYYRQF